jgi:hypothetical protein
MSVTITDTELQDWSDFFRHPDVNIINLSLDPAAAGGTTSRVPRCVNKRFFPNSGLVFAASENNARFGRNAPANGKRTLLSLKKDPNIPSQSLRDILLAAGVLQGKIDGSRKSQSQDVFDKILTSFLSKGTMFKLSENQLQDLTFEDKRNAMWMTPGQTLQVDTALVFSPESSALDALQQEIEHALSIKLPTMNVPLLIVQRTSKGIKSMTASSNATTLADMFNPRVASTPVWFVTNTYRVTWRITLDSFVLWVSLDPVGISVSLTTYEPDPTHPEQVSSFWSKVPKLVPGLQNHSFKPDAVEIFLDRIHLLKLGISRDAQGHALWQVTASVNLPNGGPDIYLAYDSRTSTFSGGLLLSGFFTDEDSKLLPEYQPGYDVEMPTNMPNGSSLPPIWDLRNFFSTVKIPSALPTGIVLAYASYQNAFNDKGSVLHLAAQARHVPTSTAGDTSNGKQTSVPSPFTWDELDVSFTKQKDVISCSLSTYFTLHPPLGSQYLAADIGISFAYDDGGWELHGHADNLSCGLLYSFFDSDCHNAAIDIFGKLNIKSLDLLWTHTKGGKSASFLFSGIITFGELELRLFYQYVTKDANDDTKKKIQGRLDSQAKTDGKPVPPALPGPTNTDSTWLFECDLGSSTEKATVGMIADSIIENASSNLPSFISKIPIPKADGSNGPAPISLKAKKIIVEAGRARSTGAGAPSDATASPDGKIVFVFRFALESLTLTFVQVADVPGSKTAPALRTKRLLRFAVDKLPMIGSIPLLDRLPQPFDQLEYVWVNDGGFTKDEIDLVNNSGLLPREEFLVYKEPGNSKASQDSPPRPGSQTTTKPHPNTNPVVLHAGHHFIVVHNGKVALDHVFFASPVKDDPEAGPTLPLVANAAGLGAPVGGISGVEKVSSQLASKSPTAPDPSKPAKGAVAFKLGPLAIDAVTLQYKEQAGQKSLIITMDATFTMGPITFSLLGFGLTVTLSNHITLNDLQHAVDGVGVVLAGLALSFNKPPLLVAGGFEHIKDDTQDTFLGGIGVSFPPYTFVGLGEYSIVSHGTDKYKSVFLFAKLDGPLITLEFATITGVRLGLGYNSYVNPPTVNDITTFPFINDKSIGGAGNDPMALLKKMIKPDPLANGKIWVQPKLDSYWFAAGMSITAFDILTVTAVAMLEFRDSGLVASIYADAIAEMPPGAPSGAAIVYAEIGMVAEMNFADGYFRVEASLAPTSYLLVPACRLYGGFALVYWFPVSNPDTIFESRSHTVAAERTCRRLGFLNRRLPSSLYSSRVVSGSSTSRHFVQH